MRNIYTRLHLKCKYFLWFINAFLTVVCFISFFIEDAEKTNDKNENIVINIFEMFPCQKERERERESEEKGAQMVALLNVHLRCMLSASW